MIKRDIVETVYEYDTEGKLMRKTVTETHEEDTNLTRSDYITTPYSPNNPLTVNYNNSTTDSAFEGTITTKTI